MITSCINLELFAFPASLLLGVLYLLAIWLLVHYYRESKTFKFFRSIWVAVSLTALVALFVAIDGVMGYALQHSYLFVIVAFLLMTSLGVTTIYRLYHRFSIGFTFNHLGLLLVCWSMFFGAPDHRELAILAEKENPVRVGYDKEGVMHPLPFILQLQQFELEYNGSGGTLSQYRSDILIDGEPKSVSVNNPITHGAYKLYQNGYDKEDGAYSVFRLVYDPWLWGVWLGILLLALGSLTMILRKI